MHRRPFPAVFVVFGCALSLVLLSCGEGSDRPPDCGNGTLDPEEACDGADLGGATCGSVDSDRPSGILTCTDRCTFDTSGCHSMGVSEPGRLEGITDAHNQARANVDPPADPPIPPLTWDPDLAAVAQGWAEDLASRGCPLEHSNSGYGENIFLSGGSATPADVVDLWMREAGCYDYATITCEPGTCDCGFGPCESCFHYTQVVWRDSERLGCGVGDCSGGGEIWVCNYDPAGNINVSSTRPY